MDLECLVNRLLELSAELDTDTLVTQYHKELCHLLDTHAPIKHLSITPRLRVAWFDQNTKEPKRMHVELKRSGFDRVVTLTYKT